MTSPLYHKAAPRFSSFFPHHSKHRQCCLVVAGRCSQGRCNATLYSHYRLCHGVKSMYNRFPFLPIIAPSFWTPVPWDVSKYTNPSRGSSICDGYDGMRRISPAPSRSSCWPLGHYSSDQPKTSPDQPKTSPMSQPKLPIRVSPSVNHG